MRFWRLIKLPGAPPVIKEILFVSPNIHKKQSVVAEHFKNTKKNKKTTKLQSPKLKSNKLYEGVKMSS